MNHRFQHPIDLIEIEVAERRFIVASGDGINNRFRMRNVVIIVAKSCEVGFSETGFLAFGSLAIFR